MIINLYKYKSPNIYINKTLESVADYEGTLREPASVLTPTFEIATDANLSQVNYCYIADLHRYYYVTEIISVGNKLWKLACHVDVLMTYKPQILAHEAIIARQENNWNILLNDGTTFKVQQNSDIIVKEFTGGVNSFSGGSYVMMLRG